MRHGNFEPDPDHRINWRIVSHLLPYLRESRSRVLFALLCLLLAKGAILVIPFLLKDLVDALDGRDVQALAPLALPHRCIVQPESALRGRTAEAIVAEILEATPLDLGSVEE